MPQGQSGLNSIPGPSSLQRVAMLAFRHVRHQAGKHKANISLSFIKNRAVIKNGNLKYTVKILNFGTR